MGISRTLVRCQIARAIPPTSLHSVKMFLIRVELHNTENYTPLHHRLAKVGIRRFYNVDGKSYVKLPTGSYLYENGGTASSVAESVKAVAAHVGSPNPSVVVVDGSAFSHLGLPRVPVEEVILDQLGL